MNEQNLIDFFDFIKSPFFQKAVSKTFFKFDSHIDIFFQLCKIEKNKTEGETIYSLNFEKFVPIPKFYS